MADADTKEEQFSITKLLAEFDCSRDKCNLNYTKFHSICMEIYQRDEVERNEWRVQEIFRSFDRDEDNLLKDEEWDLFEEWLRVTLKPKTAFVIVDVQNDFIDGSLALRSCGCGQDGVEVIDPINHLTSLGRFDKLIFSLDWHPDDHISFYENLHLRELHPDSKIKKQNAQPFDKIIFANPYREQILWPKHCVMNTWGAELHKNLVVPSNAELIRKGKNSEVEAYSVFSDENEDGSIELHRILKRADITDLYVCGIAYDVCVKATCLDALRLGYALAVVDHCCRYVNEANVFTAKKLISESGGLIASSDCVLSLVNERKRSLVMGHQRAKGISSIEFQKSLA